MGLVRAVAQAITQPHAPSRSDVAISQSGLATSSQAVRLIQKSGKEDAAIVNQMTSALASPKGLTQAKTDSIATKTGLITQRYHKLKAIEPIFNAAMDDAAKSAALQAKMATKAATTGQKIAVLNAETQAKLGFAHQEASVQVAHWRSAYSEF